MSPPGRLKGILVFCIHVNRRPNIRTSRALYTNLPEVHTTTHMKVEKLWLYVSCCWNPLPGSISFCVRLFFTKGLVHCALDVLSDQDTRLQHHACEPRWCVPLCTLARSAGSLRSCVRTRNWARRVHCRAWPRCPSAWWTATSRRCARFSKAEESAEAWRATREARRPRQCASGNNWITPSMCRSIRRVRDLTHVTGVLFRL